MRDALRNFYCDLIGEETKENGISFVVYPDTMSRWHARLLVGQDAEVAVG